jgi:hypothetical protein
LLSAFVPLAFRRPTAPELTEHDVAIAHQRLEAGTAFDEALLETYKSILCPLTSYFLTETRAPSTRTPSPVAFPISLEFPPRRAPARRRR